MVPRDPRIRYPDARTMWPIDWLLMYCIFDAWCLFGPPNRTTPTATRLLAVASAQILVAPYPALNARPAALKQSRDHRNRRDQHGIPLRNRDLRLRRCSAETTRETPSHGMPVRRTRTPPIPPRPPRDHKETPTAQPPPAGVNTPGLTAPCSSADLGTIGTETTAPRTRDRRKTAFTPLRPPQHGMPVRTQPTPPRPPRDHRDTHRTMPQHDRETTRSETNPGPPKNRRVPRAPNHQHEMPMRTRGPPRPRPP